MSLWCWTSASWVQKRLAGWKESCETSGWCGLGVCSEPSSVGWWRSGKSNPEWPPQGQTVLCLQGQELNPALWNVSAALSKSVLFFYVFKHILCNTVKHSEKSLGKKKSLGGSLGRGKKQDRELAIQPSYESCPRQFCYVQGSIWYSLHGRIINADSLGTCLMLFPLGTG